MKRVTAFLSVVLLALPATPSSGAPSAEPSASATVAPSASATATAVSSASAAPVSDAIDVGATEGPKPGSAPPTKEEWAKVTHLMGSDGKPVGASVSCDTFILKGWVRLTCTKLTVASDEASAFGAVWGVAGALDEVKAEMTLVGTGGLSALMKEGVPTVRNMASAAEVVFPIRPGSAVLIEVSGARWAYEEYNGNFFTSIDKGFLVDASWALGEKTPTLIFDSAS